MLAVALESAANWYCVERQLSDKATRHKACATPGEDDLVDGSWSPPVTRGCPYLMVASDSCQMISVLSCCGVSNVEGLLMVRNY
jgi:hypothetical protein